MKPLTLCIIGLFLFINTIYSQTSSQTIESDPTTQISNPITPSFEVYTDKNADFVYIQLSDAEPYEAYQFVINNADEQTAQIGFVNNNLTSKVAIKHLAVGNYSVSVLNEEGNLLEERKMIYKSK